MEREKANMRELKANTQHLHASRAPGERLTETVKFRKVWASSKLVVVQVESLESL